MEKLWILLIATAAFFTACKKDPAKPSKTNKTEAAKSAPQADRKISFGYRLAVGETYPLILNTTQKITQNFGAGKSEHITQASGFDIAFQIKEEKADRYLCEAVYKTIRTKMDSQAGQMSINTAEKRPSDEKAFLWDAMKAIIGKKLAVELGKNGMMLSVKGFDKIYQEIRTRLKKQLPPQNLENLILVLKQSFSDETFKKTYEQSRLNFPDRAIGLGESWEKKVDEKIAGQTKKGKETYILKEVKDGVAQVDVDVSIDGIAQETKNEMGTEKLSLSGSQKGTVMIHLDSGWLKKADLTQNIQGKISVHSGKKKLEIPMSIQGDISAKGI